MTYSDEKQQCQLGRLGTLCRRRERQRRESRTSGVAGWMQFLLGLKLSRCLSNASLPKLPKTLACRSFLRRTLAS